MHTHRFWFPAEFSLGPVGGWGCAAIRYSFASRVTHHAVVVGEGTLQEETLSVAQTRKTKWDITVNPQKRELLKNGNFEEHDNTDTSRFPCLSCV